MSFFVQTRWGGSESSPSLDRMKEILAELDTPDPEHPDASLQHESGWSLSAFEAGVLVWENLESGAPPRHMSAVPHDRVLQLWLRLSEGKVDEVDREPWRSGYAEIYRLR